MDMHLESIYFNQIKERKSCMRQGFFDKKETRRQIIGCRHFYRQRYQKTFKAKLQNFHISKLSKKQFLK